MSPDRISSLMQHCWVKDGKQPSGGSKVRNDSSLEKLLGGLETTGSQLMLLTRAHGTGLCMALCHPWTQQLHQLPGSRLPSSSTGTVLRRRLHLPSGANGLSRFQASAFRCHCVHEGPQDGLSAAADGCGLSAAAEGSTSTLLPSVPAGVRSGSTASPSSSSSSPPSLANPTG
jgi:hypothetical protein